MFDLLRDPIWQFVGAALAVVGIGVAYLIYWLQRRTKEMAFGRLSSRRLISIADEVSSRITVQLDGKAVKNLHLCIYGLKNSGHHAITATDFYRPLSIYFPDGQIISAEIASQTPSSLGAKLVVSESRIELQPLLLNAGDELLIQVLLSAPAPSESVDTRILDIPALVPIIVNSRLSPILDETSSFLFLLMCLGAIAGYFAIGELPYSISVVLVFAAVLYIWRVVLALRMRPLGRTRRRSIRETSQETHSK